MADSGGPVDEPAGEALLNLQDLQSRVIQGVRNLQAL